MKNPESMTNRAQYAGLRDETRRLDLAVASPLPHPLTIYVEPTNVCNFRCSFCPESLDDYQSVAGGHHMMSIDAFKTLCEQTLALGRLRVMQFYMMGEPFANKMLPDFVLIARRMNVADRLIVTSNATLITAETAERVIRAGLDYARFSIYAATDKRMRAVTGSKVPLSRLVRNIAVFRRMRDELGLGRPHIYIKMIDSQDAAENDEFFRLFSDLADEISIEPVMDWNGSTAEPLANVPRDEMLQSEYFKHRKKACPMPFYTLVVHSDLRVSVCCVDWAKQAVVGDLRVNSLVEIWRGRRLLDFRLTHLRGERQTLAACSNCNYLFTLPDSVDNLDPEQLLRAY